MDDRIVLSLLVDNTAGVLARVAGLFSRRGYNIESLTVGVTADPRYSRMTVVSLGDQTVLEQIKNQLNKLEDVRDIKELQPDRSVYRELMMVKVRANASDRQSVSAISSIFRATIVDVGKDSQTSPSWMRLLTCWRIMKSWSWPEPALLAWSGAQRISGCFRKTEA